MISNAEDDEINFWKNNRYKELTGIKIKVTSFQVPVLIQFEI